MQLFMKGATEALFVKVTYYKKMLSWHRTIRQYTRQDKISSQGKVKKNLAGLLIISAQCHDFFYNGKKGEGEG